MSTPEPVALAAAASRRTPRDTFTALAAASVLALLEICRTSLTRVLDGHAMSFSETARHVFPMWITVVLVSPWCAFMAARFPLRAGRMARTLLAHAAGGVVFAALHVTMLLLVHGALALLLRGRLGFARDDGAFIPLRFGPGLLHLYGFYAAMEMSVYAAIVLVLLLLEARRDAAERAVASARLERGLAAARLEGLQSQIRPHFLFNTLNALAVLARRGDGAAVDRAIGDLGELLRASFDTRGRHEIPLREELEFLARYVELQRIRFPSRLEVEWVVADEARSALVPALVVQALVENAIEHGLGTAQGGRVRVVARREGDPLVIEVTDRGPGFGPTGTAPGSPERQGVGLANTRERLALLYGALGALDCVDDPEGGGIVRLRVPLRTSGDEDTPP